MDRSTGLVQSPHFMHFQSLSTESCGRSPTKIYRSFTFLRSQSGFGTRTACRFGLSSGLCYIFFGKASVKICNGCIYISK